MGSNAVSQNLLMPVSLSRRALSNDRPLCKREKTKSSVQIKSSIITELRVSIILEKERQRV